MAENSKIGWTDHTFNPWWGCVEAAGHPGCVNCYAREQSHHYKKAHWGKSSKGGTRNAVGETRWSEVMKWQKRAAAAGRIDSVFCASMADVFEEWDGNVLNFDGTATLPEGDELMTLGTLRARLFRLWAQTPNLRWLILTKRPENVRRFWPIEFAPDDLYALNPIPMTLKNVWVGTSISNQQTADVWLKRLAEQHLRGICAGTFCSAEPLLGKVILSRAQLDALDWLIVGGESGGRSRFYPVAHGQRLVEQAIAAELPVFHKQVGDKPIVEYYDEDDERREWALSWPNKTMVFSAHHNTWLKHYTRVDGQPPENAILQFKVKTRGGTEPAEWPAPLRVQQFPWGAKGVA